jgi:hypothetical protein
LEQRYGFKRNRYRCAFASDRKLSLHGLSDIAVTSEVFVQMALPIKRVFVTENEINFLSFPDVADGLILFGGGYGFEHLSSRLAAAKEIFTGATSILMALRFWINSGANFLGAVVGDGSRHITGAPDVLGNEDRPASGN